MVGRWIEGPAGANGKEPVLGLFGKKKTEPESPAKGEAGNGSAGEGGAGGSGAAPGGALGGGVEFSPEKAAKFFERARTVHEATNYEYAMQLWLGGLRLNPTSMPALIGFFESAAAFLGSKEGARGPGREIVREFSGRGDVDRFLLSLLQWGTRPLDGGLAVRATEAAAKLRLRDAALWLGDRALGAAQRAKRPRKDHFLTLLEVFHEFEAYDKAVTAGELAVQQDPADGKLAARVRNISAEQTMSRSGFDQTGQEGAFRANVRDSDKQRMLDQEERKVKSEETMDRLVESAREEYQAKPTDRPAIKKYFERLTERGRPQDERTALEVARRAYDLTQEYRFRQLAGEIELRWARRKVEGLRQAAAANPADAAAKEAFEAAQRECLRAEIVELESRMEAYPSDLVLKFELGKRYFDVGRFEDAIGLFQKAKDEPRLRARVLNALGLAFQAIGWHDEAIETFRQAMDVTGLEEAVVMELRYGLLCSLQARAAEQEDLSNAEEAYKIASSIAIVQINYRDIRMRREELKALITRLKKG